ncbi:DNA double-strand break repair Rad50 ATPase [Candidatus Phytoplasma asteris]|uniref:DNA double-strand break repair Rad50 ATPase n=1 Tax=Candidatus Phytoplasma asteris TaxID=85620 RepID=A0ABZ2YFJ1_9MOLU
MSSYYNRFLALFLKSNKKLSNEFFSPFLSQLTNNITKLKNTQEKKTTPKIITNKQNQQLNQRLQTLNNKHNTQTKQIQEKYNHILLNIYEQIEKLQTNKKTILQKYKSQQEKIQALLNQELIYQKNKNNDKNLQLKEILQKELQEITKKNNQKETTLITNLNNKNNNINNLLIQIEKDKQKLELKKKKLNQESKQNFYTTDFNLNQKNTNLLKQLETTLNLQEKDKQKAINILEQIKTTKEQTYQKNITKTHKIYQNKLSINDKKLDIIKEAYQQERTLIQEKMKAFFLQIRPFPFINIPILFNYQIETSKKALFYNQQKNCLSYQNQKSLWSQQYHFINLLHQKAINMWHLEHHKQNKYKHIYQQTLEKIYHLIHQKTNYLFFQKINGIKEQIKTVLNLHLQETAIFDNQKDYQETFFAYQKTLLALQRKQNNYQIDYYYHFFEKKQEFELKTKSIALQLKLEKTKIQHYYLEQITTLKKEINNFQTQLTLNKIFQKDDFLTFKLTQEKEKYLFLQDVTLMQKDIYLLLQTQNIELLQTLNILLNNYPYWQKESTLLEQTLQQTQLQINTFASNYQNKTCIIKQTILDQIKTIIENNLFTIIQKQFNQTIYLLQKKHQLNQTNLQNEIDLNEQIIAFYDKQLTFLNQKINTEKNKGIQGFFHKYKQKGTDLYPLLYKIKTHKECYEKNIKKLTQKKDKATKKHKHILEKTTIKHQKKINKTKLKITKLLNLWHYLKPVSKNIAITPLINFKISNKSFFNACQKTITNVIKDILFYNDYQKNIYQCLNNLLQEKIKKEQSLIQTTINTTNTIKHLNKVFYSQNELIKNFIHTSLEKKFKQNQISLLQEITKTIKSKEKSLTQTTNLMKEKLGLLNENLNDALINLNLSWQQTQKELRQKLSNLKKEALLNFEKKDKLFFENKKIAIKQKNNQIFKHFIKQKEKISQSFTQKRKSNHKKITKIGKQIQKTKKKLITKIKLTNFKTKIKTIFLKCSFFWQKQKGKFKIKHQQKQITKQIQKTIELDKQIS